MFGNKVQKRGQIWFTDFVIALMVFSFLLVAYYVYTTNVSKEERKGIDNLIIDAESISQAVIGAGFPQNWNDETVQRIGVTNNDHVLNTSKYANFKNTPYNKTKKLFGTIYSYVLFFIDDNNSIINVEGVCGVGAPMVNITFNAESAYYFDNDGDSYLKDFMENIVQADIYSAEPGYPDFNAFISGINDYGFIVMEHPMLSAADFDTNKAAIEGFISNNGIVMLSGEIVNAPGRELAAAGLHKKADQSISQRNATVVAEFLPLEVGENIIFSRAHYVENQSGASNFSTVVKFVADGENAVSHWSYGAGKVLYFSSVNTSRDLQEVKSAVNKWANLQCSPIGIEGLEYDDFIRIERFMIYNGNPVKMVLYVWE